MIQLSPPQLEEMRGAAGEKNRFWNEKVWSLLLAEVLTQPATRDYAVARMCPGRLPSSGAEDVYFEGQPKSPRKGTSGDTEGNTRLDLAFGHVKRRGGTASGIEFGPAGEESWACFVEAKCLSDCSGDVSYDPFRNQLARVIENLLCFGSDAGRPETCYFTLVTPRAFMLDRGQFSRLYAYKMREYEDRDLLLRDLKNCTFPMRDETIDLCSAEFRRRLEPDRLVLAWTDFESLLVGPAGIGAPATFDLLDEEWDPGLAVGRVVERLQMEAALPHP